MKTLNLRTFALCTLSAAALSLCAAAAAGLSGGKALANNTQNGFETLCADYNGASTEAAFDNADSLQSGREYVGFSCNGAPADITALCDAQSQNSAGAAFIAAKQNGAVTLDFLFNSEIFNSGCKLDCATVFLSGTQYSAEFYLNTKAAPDNFVKIGSSSTSATDKSYSFHSVSALAAGEDISALRIIISGGNGQTVTVREADINLKNDPAEIKAVKDELNKDITVPSLFSDNMLLKHRSRVKVWGYGGGADGNTVTIAIGGQTKTATVQDYQWSAVLDPLPAGTDYTLKFEGVSNSIEIKNVAAGEVFIAAGQSNMQRTIKKLDGADDADYIKGYGSAQLADIKEKPNQSIRLFNQNSVSTRNEHLKDVASSGWNIADFDSAYNFSAVGYFFARELASKLNVPVGVIYAAVGGSRIQGWYSRERLLAVSDAELLNEQRECIDFYAGDTSANSSQSACNYFNGMVKPLMPYTVSGVLWYQGESNVGDYKIYHKLMKIMEDGWREGFDDPELSFLCVQVAPYDRSGYNQHRIAVSQSEMIYLLKNTYLTVISDTPWEEGKNNIHPQNKVPVGVRLSNLARQFIYGEDVNAQSPLFGGMDFNDGIFTITISNAGGGLKTTDGAEPVGFEISEDGKKFFPASATVTDVDKVAVWDFGLAEPKYVRYGYNPAFTGTLVTEEGLPVGIFATDMLLFDIDEPREVTPNIKVGKVNISVETGGTLTLPQTVKYTLDGAEHTANIEWQASGADTSAEGVYEVRGFSTDGRYIIATAVITVANKAAKGAGLTALWISLGAVGAAGACAGAATIIFIKRKKRKN